MTVHEPIYGDIDIASPCLRELLHAPSVLRLHGIAQLGFPDALYFKDGFSRYEHSIGAMALLARLGASEEEQIAGLLHDVSHMAFSHVVDWVIGDPTRENYQDEHHEQYIRGSELPSILARHEFDVARIVNYHLFSLLEQDAPALCADRIDYTLRELPCELAQSLARALRKHCERIVFDSQSAAQTFANAYMQLQENSWGGLESMSRYRAFGAALKRTLTLGIISEDDLWTTDEAVLRKLESSGDAQTHRVLEVLRLRSWDHLPRDVAPTQKKFRWIDPAVLCGDGEARSLSALNPDYGEALDRAKQKNAAGMALAIVA